MPEIDDQDTSATDETNDEVDGKSARLEAELRRIMELPELPEPPEGTLAAKLDAAVAPPSEIEQRAKILQHNKVIEWKRAAKMRRKELERAKLGKNWKKKKRRKQHRAAKKRKRDVETP